MRIQPLAIGSGPTDEADGVVAGSGLRVLDGAMAADLGLGGIRWLTLSVRSLVSVVEVC